MNTNYFYAWNFTNFRVILHTGVDVVLPPNMTEPAMIPRTVTGQTGYSLYNSNTFVLQEASQGLTTGMQAFVVSADGWWPDHFDEFSVYATLVPIPPPPPTPELLLPNLSQGWESGMLVGLAMAVPFLAVRWFKRITSYSVSD